jgi:hypothetical protein
MQKGKSVAIAVVGGALLLTAAGVSISTAASASRVQSASKTHTIRFISKKTSHERVGVRFVDSDKDVLHGQRVGDDVVTGTRDPETASIEGDVTYALIGGQIRGHFTLDLTTGHLTGEVTGGVGTFQGVTGTITGRPSGSRNQNQRLMIKYH